MSDPARLEVRNEIVRLDYAELRDTNYTDCKLVFKGGTPPTMINCNFMRCAFIFANEALSNMRFLAGIAHGTGGRDLILREFLGLNDG